MSTSEHLESRIRNAWLGRISGCMLGKAVELFSMREGHDALTRYLQQVNALPLRGYIPFDPDHASSLIYTPCCKDHLHASAADDDINYSVLALILLETHGKLLKTEDVARSWLKYLPLASTFTAERAAYKTLLSKGKEWFPEGSEPGFDILQCADNPYNDWIGAQIRADVYGWVCPGNPDLAAHLATTDAQLSHQSDGIYGAVVIAVMGALLANGSSMTDAVDQALTFIPADSNCSRVIAQAKSLADSADGGHQIRETFPDMSVVHTVNNLGLVIWALLRYPDDFDAAVGDVVAAGLDTDCNGATVGALWALQGKSIPAHWYEPWQGKVGVSLAGMAQLDLEDLVQRTVKVADKLKV
ncbi:MAG: ADP-ribosylglycohydrolase family protein [bacterium]